MTRKKLFALLLRSLIIILAVLGIANYLGLLEGKFNPKTLSYYTIQSNILILFYFGYVVLFMVRHWGGLTPETISPFPRFKGGLTYAITITAIVYNVILVPNLFTMSSYQPYGLFDNIVHIVVPLMVVIDWLIIDPKPVYQMTDPLAWQMIPFLYLVFVLIRAQIGGLLTAKSRYPYFFIDIDRYGMAAVLGNIALLMAASVVLAYAFYGIDRLVGKARGKAALTRGDEENLPRTGITQP